MNDNSIVLNTLWKMLNTTQQIAVENVSVTV